MKKVLLAVMAIAVLGVTSCKKEEGAQPEGKTKSEVLHKKDTTQWD